MKANVMHNIGAVLKVVFARLRFLSVFLIAALLVGYWDEIKNHVDKWTRPAMVADVRDHAHDVEYFCVMHPNIVRDEPGNCPICGMPLVRREKGAGATTRPAEALARVQLSPQRIALAGIGTSLVEMRVLTRRVHALGVLDYNETKIARLSAWVAGRADQLFVQFVGQAVKKDDPVYSLYSPDVYTALREYLSARKRVNELPKDTAVETRTDAAAVYNASLQKLVLWGISQTQLDQADRDFDQNGKVPTHLIVTSPISGIVVGKEIFEGGYVNVGDRPYTIADLSTLWLQLKLYERDVPLVKIGQGVDVHVEALPNEVFHGTVTFEAFAIDPATRTLDARVEVANTDLRLRPGMFGEATIEVPVGGVRQDASETATQPAARAASTSAPSAIGASDMYAAALEPYLKAHALLAADQTDGVTKLLQEAADALKPLGANPEVEKFTAAAHASMGQDLDALRKTSFRDASAAMIALGKSIGLRAGAKSVSVFHCPMADADWLQHTGGTMNPFYGSKMLDCGAAVESLPKTAAPSAKAQATTRPGSRTLAIPRAAVIEAGRNRIVYVESSPGVYDMRAVELGPIAGEFYPVVGGLREGEKVVTVGAFLVDSENRLNPS